MNAAPGRPAEPQPLTCGGTVPALLLVDGLVRAAHEQVVVVTDPDFRITSISAGASRLLGWDQGEVAGLALSELFSLEELRSEAARLGVPDPSSLPLEALLSAEALTGRWTLRTRHGLRLLSDLGCSLVTDAAGRVLAAVVVGSDASTSAAVERRLADSEEQFRLAFEKAPTAMAMVSLSSATRGRLRRVNPAFTAFTGRRSRELFSMRMADLLHAEEVPGHTAYLARAAEAGETEPDGVERRFLHADGSLRWGRKSTAVVRSSSTREPHLLVLIHDVTRHKQEQEQLERAALHDPLTGLANRALFRDRLQLALDADRRRLRGVTLLYIDLDLFKPINDQYGHAAGDEVLNAVGSRLLTVMRSEDTVARLGGDEFAVICPGLQQPDTDVVVRRVVEALEAPLWLQAPGTAEQKQVVIGASVGTASTDGRPGAPAGDGPAGRSTGTDGRSALSDLADELLREADAAMYAVKQSRRPTVQGSSPEAVASDGLATSTRLRR